MNAAKDREIVKKNLLQSARAPLLGKNTYFPVRQQPQKYSQSYSGNAYKQ